MEKRNEVRADITLCDRCSNKAAMIDKDGGALCVSCAHLEKTASARPRSELLKSAAESLSNQLK